MIRNLKALGLALVAAFALSAVVASAASAQFHSEKTETRLTVSSNETQTFSYTKNGVKVTCNKVAVTATVTSQTSTDVTAYPTYSEDCTALGLPADIEFNTGTNHNCYYTFTLAEGATSGTSDLRCNNAGEDVTIKVTEEPGKVFCEYTLQPQEGLGPVVFANLGSGTTREVRLEPAVEGIKATKTKGGLLCGPATSETGTYSGKATVTGEETSSTTHVGVWVS